MEHAYREILSFIDSLQDESIVKDSKVSEEIDQNFTKFSDDDLEKEEFVGVAESPLKTFPRVNDFECGSSYRH